MAVFFWKMQGLGNDFVVIDRRGGAPALAPARIIEICDRRLGVGCDQLIVLEASDTPPASVFMRIFNADGSEAGACGNASRCIGLQLLRQSGGESLFIETLAGLLPVRPEGAGVAVGMGEPTADWRTIPLAREVDTLHLPLALGPLSDPVGVGIGNPHAVFFVPDAGAIDLAALGPALEHDPLFPERANIGVAQILAPDRLRLRVWERGAGLTPACGSGAVAAAIAVHRRGLCDRRVTVEQAGGALLIDWAEDGMAWQSGPAALVFSGVLE